MRSPRGRRKTAAEHGGEGQRDESGDQDRHGDGHGEFVEQPADDPAHEEHGDEDGDEREGHGDDGEADLPRPVERRLQRAFPLLHVADDVLQHDDGVVHHESDGQGQGHEREVVEAVIQQIHDGEGARRSTWAGPGWG